MSFPFHVVTGKTVHEIVHQDVPGCIEVVRRAYLAHAAGLTINPPSQFLRYPDHPDRRVIALAAHVGDGVSVSGIKWIASFPANALHGFPRASATLILNRPDTGYPFACLEASVVSAARTAASAVLAAGRLIGGRARRRIGLVGTGLIAKYIHAFFRAAGWSFDETHLWDLRPGEASRFAAALAARGERGTVIESTDLGDLLEACDVVVFATTAGRPHVEGRQAIGPDKLVLHISLRDLSTEIVLGCCNVVDDVDHVMNAGTSLHLAEQAVGHRRFVAGTIGDVLSGKLAPPAQGTIVFSPFGLGILDIAVGKWVYDQALAREAVVPIPDFFFEVTR